MQGEHLTTVVDISIHALRKESDPYMPLNCPLTVISIHALRKESDINHAIPQHATIDFNPRSP